MKRRNYRAWLYMIKAGQPSYWHWDSWNAMSDCITPLFSKLEGPVSIQPLSGNGAPSAYNKSLLWSIESNKKWTYFSPITMLSCETWKFMKVGLFSPTKRQCYESGSPPDFYFGLEAITAPTGLDAQVSQLLILAIAENLYELNESLVISVEAHIRALIAPIYRAELKTRFVFRKDLKNFGSCYLDEDPLQSFFSANWNASKLPYRGVLELSGATFSVISEQFDE